MTLGTARLRRRFHALLHLDDPPWRIALALAVGVFIGCTPFWFFQTLLALAVAATFGLNKAATVTGAWLNLPWFAPFVYGAALKIGTLIVPGHDASAAVAVGRLLDGHEPLDWREALEMLRGTSIALLVGTTVVGLAAALVTYVVAVRLIAKRSDDRTRTDERHAA